MDIEITRDEILEKLLKSYSTYFDVEQCQHEFLVAKCQFHVHSEKYVLVKKAKLWEHDCNEFVYIFSMPHLTEEVYRKCEKYAYEQGMERIDPKLGHMYSYITAVFLCDSFDAKAAKALKKCRIYKSFHFSFYGWMDFHTVLLARQGGRILTNRSGRDNAKLMKNIFMKKKRSE